MTRFATVSLVRGARVRHRLPHRGIVESPTLLFVTGYADIAADVIAVPSGGGGRIGFRLHGRGLRRLLSGLARYEVDREYQK